MPNRSPQCAPRRRSPADIPSARPAPAPRPAAPAPSSRRPSAPRAPFAPFAPFALFLNVRIARQLQVRQPHLAPLAVRHHAVVDAQRVGRVEADAAELRHVVVLLDTVTADAEAADQPIGAIERHAAGKPDDAALVQVIAVAAARRAGALRARVLGVVDVEVEPRTVLLLGVVALELFLEVDARREERLSGEADGAGGDRPALAGGRLRLPRGAVVLVAGVARDVAQDLVALAGAEVIGVARLGHRHVRR